MTKAEFFRNMENVEVRLNTEYNRYLTENNEMYYTRYLAMLECLGLLGIEVSRLGNTLESEVIHKLWVKSSY